MLQARTRLPGTFIGTLTRPFVPPLSALAAAAMLYGAVPAGAQQPAPPGVVGVVRDSASGLGLVGAEVVLGTRRTVTDDGGEFRLFGATTETDTLRVRRLGFRSRVVPLGPVAGAPLLVDLVAVPRELSPVVVTATWGGYRGRLAGYYQRLERRTTGKFVTRADLDAERTGMLTNVLQRVPGIHVQRGRGVGVLSLRGRNCLPLVWLDGVSMPADNLDLDSFAPSSLHGIEIYLGATTPPMRFQGLRGQSECGTIMLWSRGPDTDPVGRGSTIGPRELEELIAAQSVYRADQVEAVASIDSSTLVVAYPPLLRAMKVGGSVIAEFVVDQEGRVDAESIGIVAATDPPFAEAVRQALAVAQYVPATRGGRAVRQLVRQRFTFDAPR